MIITLDLQHLAQIVYRRLTQDAAGAAARAALGAGAASIIPADQLNASTLPTRPFIALREGALVPSGGQVGIYLANYSWWLYDDPQQGAYRLRALVPLIGRAYDHQASPLPSPAGGAINRVDIGPLYSALPDPALGGILAARLPLVIYL